MWAQSYDKDKFEPKVDFHVCLCEATERINMPTGQNPKPFGLGRNELTSSR